MINVGLQLLPAAWLGVALAVAACGPAGSPTNTDTGAVDMESGRERLLEADQRFAELSVAEGTAEAYRQYMAENALQLPDGGLPLEGRAAIYDNVKAISDGQDYTLTWQADEAGISASGDLGYTLGTYWYSATDADGGAVSVEGKYLNIWRRQTDGSWKVIVDMDNENPAVIDDFREPGLPRPGEAAAPPRADS